MHAARSATGGFVTVNKSGGMAGGSPGPDVYDVDLDHGTDDGSSVEDTNAISGDATIVYTTVNADTLADYDKAVTVNVAVQVTDDDAAIVASRRRCRRRPTPITLRISRDSRRGPWWYG